MTPRMTAAVAVLTIGLGVAALAGIPLFFDNRGVGDIFMLVGLAMAIVGVVLVVFAVRWRKGDVRAVPQAVQLSDVDLYGHRFLLREQRELLEGQIQRHVKKYVRADLQKQLRLSERLAGQLLALRHQAAEIDAAIIRTTVELEQRELDPFRHDR